MNETGLRALVSSVQQRVMRVTSPATTDDQRELVQAWDALVQQLALGPEPETRKCPHCASTIMSAATLCGHCWTKLSHG